jgi:hypothetical protein
MAPNSIVPASVFQPYQVEMPFEINVYPHFPTKGLSTAATDDAETIRNTVKIENNKVLIARDLII